MFNVMDCDFYTALKWRENTECLETFPKNCCAFECVWWLNSTTNVLVHRQTEHHCGSWRLPSGFLTCIWRIFICSLISRRYTSLFWNTQAIISSKSKTLTSILLVLLGVPFTRVFGLDRDDPQTPNAHLSYSLASQIPNKHQVLLFQIDPNTGDISTTEAGSNTQTWTQTSAHRTTVCGKVCNLPISACNLAV